MNRRGILCGIVLLAVAGSFAPARAAQGTLALTWDSCTGPISRSSAGPGTYSLFFSVQGIDVPHSGYEVGLVYGNSNDVVPDAWRFDSTGCQGASLITVRHLPPPVLSQACPAFMQDSAPSIQLSIVRLSPPVDLYPLTLMKVYLANVYHSGVAVVDPNQRYFLAEIDFDHSHSVPGVSGSPEPCGGFEQDITFKVTFGGFVDRDEALLYQFNRPNPLLATFSAAVPARATT